MPTIQDKYEDVKKLMKWLMNSVLKIICGNELYVVFGKHCKNDERSGNLR